MNDLSSVSPPIINFALSDAQIRLTATALEAASGQKPATNAFTVEDVARAIILIQGGGFLEFYEDVPFFTSEEDHDHYFTNYMDGVAKLDWLVGPLVVRHRTKRILEGNELSRIALGDRMVTSETNSNTH